MERAKRRRYPIWLRIVFGLMIAVALLLVTAVALRFWITSDSGRAFILSQVDGRKVGPFGTLRLSGLKGDPLDEATLADIALIDDDGVWLRARDARIEWTPTSLFAGEVKIRTIAIRTVEVLRRPKLALQDDNSPAPDIGLSLDSVSVGDLNLAEPVLGIPARYAIDGGAARPRDGSGFVRLTLTPVEGPDDKADIAANWTAAGSLKAAATMSGPAGGLIATVVQAPEGKPVAFTGEASGTLLAFTGKGQLKFGDEDSASFDISRAGDSARLTAHLDPAEWPILAPYAARTGGRVDIAGKADLTDIEKAPTVLNLSMPAGAIEASAPLDYTTGQIPMEIAIRATSVDLATVAAPLAGKADATGVLGFDLAGVEWRGDVSAQGFEWPSGAADSVSTPLELTIARNNISWNATAIRINGGRITPVADLAPANYDAAVRGEMNLRTGLIEIHASQVEGAPASASARGSYNTRTGAIDFQGAARFARLADVSPLSGSTQSRWTLKQTSASAPLRISADVEGRNISSSNTTLAELTGSTPRVVLSAVVSNGRFAVESGKFEGAGLRANMTGRIADNGAITGQAGGMLRRCLDVGGAVIEAAAFNATVSGTMKKPEVDVRLRDGAVTAAGVAIRDLSGTADASLGDAISGAFALTGASDIGPFRTSGDIRSGEGDFRVENLKASLGDLKFTSPRLSVSDGALAATFTASGPLAGIAGIERGALNASGKVSLGDDLVADVSGRITDLRTAGMRLDLVSFETKASGGKIALDAKARGALGAPVDLTLAITGARRNEAWTGDATLSGTVDQLPIRTSRPAIWRQSADGWSLDAAFAALRGQIDLDLASANGAAIGKLQLQDVNLRGLSRLARITPINGLVTGVANFNNGVGPATGDLRLTIANANPVGVTADPATVSLTADLANGRLESRATGSGQGFSLDANASIAVREGDGFAMLVDDNAPMSAAVDLHGRAEQLWALFGPENQSLRGKLDAQLRASGTLAQPALQGSVDVAEAAYEHGETGLALRDISGRGVFDQNSARISDVKANDGHGGTLAGEGQVTWNGALQGGIKFRTNNLRVLGRDDRLAVVSGDGAVEVGDQATAITGAFVVQQARVSVEQPASSSIPTIPGLRRTNFPNQTDDESEAASAAPSWLRPVRLDLAVSAPRRIMVFGRGLNTEWGADVHVTGPIADPTFAGSATLVRGDLDLAGRRFQFDTGVITLDGPIRTARIDIAANRSTSDITASVRVTGTPEEPKFVLESTPALPQDQVLARVLFGRSVTELSGFEAAQLAAGLAQLAGGQAGFDPAGLVRKATGLDRVTFGAEDGIATVSAGKYVAEDVYVQVGAGGAGGAAAEVEWEPTDGLSIISSADGNGDTKIAVRWKKDY
jgi:translocation and assembly module TamB